MKRATTSRLAAQPERRDRAPRGAEARSQADRVRASLLLCPGKSRRG